MKFNGMADLFVASCREAETDFIIRNEEYSQFAPDSGQE